MYPSYYPSMVTLDCSQEAEGEYIPVHGHA